MKNLSLKELVAYDLPSGFLGDLYNHLGIVYKQAYEEVYANSAYEESEAEYLLGHYRRCLCEAKFRNIAEQRGIEIEMMQSGNGGCKHVQIICGRFRFALCHVQSKGAFPRHSYAREQYSKINEHIAQRSLFPVESTPGKSDIFGVIVHTEENRKDNFGFAGIGFPDETFSNWVDQPIDIQDIIDCQAEQTKIASDNVDKAQPILKVPLQKTKKNNEA